MDTLNITIWNYQILIFITKVIRETYLFMGAYNPKISLTLPLDVSLDSTLFLEVIYITAFKQGVDPL